MDCRFGRSNHSIFNINSMPRTTNELRQILYESNWMDCSLGRFFNSNSPAKSLKLNLPIWMDSNDLQFNMWNDFDCLFVRFHASLRLLSQSLSFTWVNEFLPILIVFNRSNPSIWNVWTDSKQSSPISIDRTRVNREKSNIV